MSDKKISRRRMLQRSGWAVAGSVWAAWAACVPAKKGEAQAEEKQPSAGKRPWRISLNTSTISGYKLPVQQQIDACAAAGFDGIELWTRDVEAFVKQGGSYQTLKRQLESSGLVLENMIGFSSWAADDPARRQEGLGQMRHDMEMAAALGSRFIAAPVQGLAHFDRTHLPDYAARYKAILDLGQELGVTPLVELWGAGVLSQLADAVALAIASGHPKAAVLLDFYHLYRGGNPFESLSLVNGKALPVFHINDYPSQPPRTALKDADRVFPGDGICPFKKILPLLYDGGFRGALSVELFNKGYWETMGVEEVLRKSFAKTAQVIDNVLPSIHQAAD